MTLLCDGCRRRSARFRPGAVSTASRKTNRQRQGTPPKLISEWAGLSVGCVGVAIVIGRGVGRRVALLVARCVGLSLAITGGGGDVAALDDLAVFVDEEE